MKLFQLFLSVTLVAACTACTQKVIIKQPEVVQGPVIPPPIVPVLDHWQTGYQESSYASEQNNPLQHDQDLWQRIIAAYGFNQNIDNPRIRSQLNWYKKHQGYMDRVATRAQRYIYQIGRASCRERV